MKISTILLACILFFISVVPIVAQTDEITEARIAGENDAEGFKWKWFAAGYVNSNTSVLVILLVDSLDRNYLKSGISYMNPACCLAMWGAYLSLPTAVATIHSPTPPPDRLLGRSPEWINAYTKSYKNTMRSRKAVSSGVGCLAGGAVLSAIIYAFFVTVGVNRSG